ncbi:MAG: O-acetyl-ADP-ribose deacetylase [Candidatus Lokiarchaeota archaeon]|nr:O-acetyl-ADP-ribose deacetylase [Candidatus Lokiarchaeota archaeon]
MDELKINNSKIRLVKGDITELGVDAIVNAANAQLIMGGGVAGAIKSKGGLEIQKEATKKAPISVGEAVITTGGELQARYVIHAVGPRQGEGEEETKLKNATQNSLKLMDINNLRTIAFPAISTGIFGYPIEKCADIMISMTKSYLNRNTDTGIEEVIFCLYTQEDYDIFKNKLK